MDITPLVSTQLKIIQSYGDGFFRINGEVFRHSVIVCGDEVLIWQQSGNVAENKFNPEVEFADIISKCEVLLIGAGKTFRPLPPSMRQKFKDIGVQVDIMDTPSACRTYNVMTAEGRRVAVALSTI